MTNSGPPPRAPGRPRSEATERAILDTAAMLLERDSYRSISIERIASEAHVGKQSIYRWWDGKADVLLEAFAERALKSLPVLEPTGHAIADLTTLLKTFFASVSRPAIGRTLRGLIAEAQLDPEFRAKFHAMFITARRKMIREIIGTGIASGELRRDLDIETVVDIIYGAFWYRLLSGSDQSLDEAYADQLIAVLAPILLPPRRGSGQAAKS